MLLAVTRELSPTIQHCELVHRERQPIDLERARAQHEDYERLLQSLGCRVRRLPSNPDMPDAVFVEDAAIVLDELAVVTRPGAVSRRTETQAVAELLQEHRPVVALTAPATLDGGDVLQLGRELVVGRSTRTNEAGVTALREAVAPVGYSVRAVPVVGCLHLKTAVTAVGSRTLLINPDWVAPEAFRDCQLIEVDPAEPFAANALRVGDVVVHPAGFVATQERLEARSIAVAPVDLSELAKAEGGVTCCSLLFDVS
jgi:dimethylargininase